MGGRPAGNGPEGLRWPPGPPARTQSEHPWPYSVWRRRSLQAQVAPERVGLVLPTEQPSLLQDGDHVVHEVIDPARQGRRHEVEPVRAAVLRSEEHTSELQSRFDLVCRLLLEKK